MHIEYQLGRLYERDNSVDIGIGGRIVLKCISEEVDV
jgi:hypothetical protein